MREVMLILHFIGLTMGLGTGFAHAFLSLIVSKMPTAEATKFRLHSLVLTKMGNIGIGLLIVSGLYLMTPYWKILPSSPLLIIKLILVVILAVVITIINVLGKKARTGNPEVQFKKMQALGKLTMVLGLGIVFVAVYVFH